MNSKNRKQLRKQLVDLERRQLVALGKQKTNVPYRELLNTPKDQLVELLVPVKGVLKPEAA